MLNLKRQRSLREALFRGLSPPDMGRVSAEGEHPSEMGAGCCGHTILHQASLWFGTQQQAS